MEAMEGGASSSSLVAGKGRGRGRFVRVEHMAMADEEGPQVKELDHEQTSTGGVEDDKESSSMEAVHETAIYRIGDLSRNYEVRLTKGLLDYLTQKHPEEIAKLLDEFKKINPHPPGSSDAEFLKLLFEECHEDALGAVKKRVADLITLTEVDQDLEAASNFISIIKAEFVEKMDGIFQLFIKGLMDYETLEKKHQKIGRDLLQWLDMKVIENFEVDGAPQQLKVELQSFMNGYWRGLRAAMEMEGFGNCCNQKNQNQALEKVEKKPEEELEHEPMIY